MSKMVDSNALLYFWQKLKVLFAGKVDVVSGKGLSSNDYTTTEKNKLAGIAANANNYSLPTASSSTLGGVKIGTNLSIDGNGVLSADAGAYTLPKASSSTLGGVKVGANLSINSSGVLSATDTTYSVATSSANGLMSSGDKSKLDNFQAASNYALKSDLSNVYVYKGSVATYADLPSSGLTAGDVYNVETDGMNYAWTGTAWDQLGSSFTLDIITNAEIDTIMAQ